MIVGNRAFDQFSSKKQKSMFSWNYLFGHFLAAGVFLTENLMIGADPVIGIVSNQKQKSRLV